MVCDEMRLECDLAENHVEYLKHLIFAWNYGIIAV